MTGPIEQVVALLRKFRVQKHYRATTESGAVRYAVFAEGAQVSDPLPYAEATAERDRMTARAILERTKIGLEPTQK